MKPKAAMLFAAGRGTRMRELTKDRPKALIKVAGKPLIDHALDMVTQTAITHSVVNTFYHADQLAEHLADRPDVTLSRETELLETGGGLRHALPLLGRDPVFTMNADAIYKGANVLDFLSAAWQPARMDALLLLVPHARAIGHLKQGDFFLEDGHLRRRADADQAPYIYASTQIISTDGLKDCPDEPFSLNFYWDKLIARGRAYGIEYPGKWVDLGQPESIPLAEKLLAE